MKVKKQAWGKMKKGILLVMLISVFLWPSNLHAKKFFVKMAFGVASGGDVEDALFTHAEYNDYISMGQEKKSQIGEGIFLEFIYQLNPYISFSIGNGYAYKILKGKTAQFSPPGAENVIVGGFTLSPEFSSEAVPICFSAIFSFPISSSFKVNFMGGVGYYFGTFESKTEWRLPSLPGFSTFDYRSWNFKGNASALGFHFGTGFDIDLTWNLFLTVDALYRMVNFNNIKSSGEMGEDTTFAFLQFYEGGKSLIDFDYRVSKASLSGISYQVGLKFKF